MVAFTVTTDEQEFIYGIAGSQLIELVDNAVESLPLREAGCGRAITAVCLIDQAEVCGCLRMNQLQAAHITRFLK